MFRKIVSAAALAVILTATAGSATAQRRQVMLDKVVAVVGGSSILYSDVETYAKELVQQRREMGYTSDRDPMNEALEARMQQKLLYNQALIDSVAINKGE
ncbi:MAG: peptidylprolyl isomerase, partial [Alistipes sp.]|nr:peptidylprolyl isomerase [Alistipes sp.]